MPASALPTNSPDDALPTRRRRWPARHKVATLLIAVAAIGIVGVAFPHGRLAAATAGRLHQVGSEPGSDVAIVFGAAVRDGQPSGALRLRLEGALELYRTQRVRAILVSGSSLSPAFDEPAVMRDWLVAAGVPADVIVLDGAGYSTDDTCDRAHEVYGLTRAVAVTQDYHIRRAVFLCRRAGIDTTGVGVVTTGGAGSRDQLREFVASINAGWGSPLRKRASVTSPPDDSLRRLLAESNARS